MPTLATFARHSGRPRQRRWKAVYDDVRGLGDGGLAPIVVPAVRFDTVEVATMLYDRTGIGSIRLVDRWCWLPDRAGLLRVIEHLGLWRYQYRGDRADCDNYAMAAAGLAGLVTGCNCLGYLESPARQHAQCIGFRHADGSPDCGAVEPQAPPARALRLLEVRDPSTCRVRWG